MGHFKQPETYYQPDSKTFMKVTIDSMLINQRQADPELNKLEEYHEKGVVTIVGAQRLLSEMKKRNPISYAKAMQYENVSEPFTIGMSAIGSAYISGDEEKASFRQLSTIMFPETPLEGLSENQQNDIMHLVGHLHSDSIYFVTRNTKDFIDEKRTNQNRNNDLSNLKRLRLKELGANILTPTELLAEVSSDNNQ